MNKLLERSILLTVGAAALTLDMTEALAGMLAGRGQETTEEGRRAVDELLDKARGEALSFRGGLESSLKKALSDAGMPSREQLEEMELKIAQLEHRLALLEKRGSASGDRVPAAEAAAGD